MVGTKDPVEIREQRFVEGERVYTQTLQRG